ncbi:hypothetical protein HUW51_11895 [Adhaeribacter swui]|uniref:VTT domain-containing protein n=1 Tax=Adhaeribacter swui TaxID=2086471 RepID=A0A7G7G8A4_9BACT|nr:hypothetical protein [Adhaeribacter swui]QNF33388.1 hypothetical protein HUW51_11895 [Adhaeribacter swui]
MASEIVKYLSVYLLSMVKFFGGPLAGISMGLSFGMTLLLSVTGMMTSVFIFSQVGMMVSRWYVARHRAQNKPIFSKKSRKIVKIWQRFGIKGIAFLTPVLFSPVIGTIMATVLGASQRHILFHMLWSAIFWGIAFTFALHELRHLDLAIFHK